MGVRFRRVLACLAALFVALSCLALPLAAHGDDVFTPQTYPLVDGSLTAMWLGENFAHSLGGITSPAVFSGTDQAFDRLLAGDVDLILVSELTDAQLVAAARSGQEMEAILIGYDGLVFLTDQQNNRLVTRDQISSIFSGETDQWVNGGPDSGMVEVYTLPTDSSAGEHFQSFFGKMSFADATAREVFTGQSRSLAYADYHYASQVWNLAGEDPRISVVDVEGTLPSSYTIRNKIYPLSTPLYAVFDHTKDVDSPTRVLAEIMASTEGQQIVADAGYVTVLPYDEEDSFPTPATPVMSEFDQQFTVNPVSISTTATYLASGRGYCAQVDQPTVSGLVNDDLVEPRWEELLSTQKDYLKAHWGVSAVVKVDHCEGKPDPHLTTEVTGNFSNLISLVSRHEAKPVATMNIRLDTGQQLTVEDLFIPATSITPMLHSAAQGNDVAQAQEMVLAWVKQQPVSFFHFSSAALDIHQTRDGSPESLEIPLASAQEYLSIYHLVDSAGLYTSDDPLVTCPVFTTRSGELCWTGEDETWETYGVDWTGGEVELAVSAGRDDHWSIRPTDGVEISTISGQGPQRIVAVVAKNPDTQPRSFPVVVEIFDPLSQIGHLSTITIDQAGRTSPNVLEPVAASLGLDVTHVDVTLPTCRVAGVADPEVVVATVTVNDLTGGPQAYTMVKFAAARGLVLSSQDVLTDAQGQASVVGVIDIDAVISGALPSVSATVFVTDRWVNVGDSPANIDVSLIPGATLDDVLTLTKPSGQSAPADGLSGVTVGVHLQNGCGEPSSGQPVAVSVSGSARVAQHRILLDEMGNGEIVVTNTVEETVELQVQSVSSPETRQRASVELTFDTVLPDIEQSQLSVPPMVIIPCDVKAETEGVVQLKNTRDGPLADYDVDIEVISGETTTPSTVTTDREGRAEITVVRGEGASVQVAARVHGYDIAGSPAIVEFIDDCRFPAPSTMSYSLSQDPVLADGEDYFTLTIYAKDLVGGYVKGLDERLKVSADKPVTVGDIVDIGYGVYSTQLKSNQAGTFAFSVKFEGKDDVVRELAKSPAEVTFLPEWSSHVKVTLDDSPSELTGGAARANDGEDSYTLRAEIYARMGVSPLGPLAGQTSNLDVVIESDDGSPLDMVQVSNIEEISPGVYEVSITSLAEGHYTATLRWTQQDDDLDTQPLTFLDPSTIVKDVVIGSR